mmetsp:Transcript_12464/g.35683  ORF Transcript_12464/g.35683 Transcript_12464/m.35683 type:complete len:221 (+) Transcript_12464:82-744(+)
MVWHGLVILPPLFLGTHSIGVGNLRVENIIISAAQPSWDEFLFNEHFQHVHSPFIGRWDDMDLLFNSLRNDGLDHLEEELSWSTEVHNHQHSQPIWKVILHHREKTLNLREARKGGQAESIAIQDDVILSNLIVGSGVAIRNGSIQCMHDETKVGLRIVVLVKPGTIENKAVTDGGVPILVVWVRWRMTSHIKEGISILPDYRGRDAPRFELFSPFESVH